jgi:23S rRNA (uracil1939-C5)-methyltransferase
VARAGRSRRGRGRRPSRGARSREAAPLLELTIDELAAGGDGVGRAADGRVVFVPFTAPGDRVRVRVEGEHQHFLHARVEELLVASPRRTDPACAVFGSCGGCAWQHVEYAAQLEAKVKIVSDAFVRIGGIAPPGGVRITPSPSAYGYRSRARLLVAGGRVGFRRRRSHVVCATGRCPILAPPLQAELASLADRPPPSDGEWELFCGDEEARASALPAPDERRALLRVGDERLGISPGVFAQSNGLLLGALADAVLSAAGEGALAFDLFAGAGFFTLGLARHFVRVTAVESSPAAVGDLEANLRAAGIENARVLPERLEAAFERGLFGDERPDVVVLDPPRTGLPPGSSDALVDLWPRRIVYLACDPATQARDARYLTGGGYEVTRIEALDLFPQTPHVESLAVLERLSER